MKQALLVILSIILIYTARAQEIEYTSPLPKFTPYQNSIVADSGTTFNFEVRELGLEQPARWLSIDPMADKYPGWSPYVYCHDDPMSRIDPNGKWDIKVHLYSNRGNFGDGFAQLLDRKGNIIYTYEVHGKGIGGRDRNVQNSDTPTGVYKIPDYNMWESISNKVSYGPNDVLRLIPESGEILETGRSGILQHGGRQENTDNPVLKDTKGCIRVFDNDQKNLIDITNELMQNDSEEKGGKYTIENDLQKPIIVKPEEAKNNEDDKKSN